MKELLAGVAIILILILISYTIYNKRVEQNKKQEKKQKKRN